MENVNFYTFDDFCFRVSRPILLKLHILARLIKSFPMTCGQKSCDKEKLLIPLEAHHKAQSSENFLSFQTKKKLKELHFYLLANPAETAYFSFLDQELSNDVCLVQVRRRKVAVHTFLGWSQAGLLIQRSCRNYQKPLLFCLRSYPGEIVHSNSAYRELYNDVLDVVVRRRKVALHTCSHLTPTEV